MKKSGLSKVVLISVIVVLVAVTLQKGIRWVIRARSISAPSACINNLRQFDGAQQQWALEHKVDSHAVVTWENIRPYVKLDSHGELPRCSGGGTYTIGQVTNPPRCSIMWHNMSFGHVAVSDERGVPLDGASVAVVGPKGEICRIHTSTNGAGHLFDDSRPGLWYDVTTNSWSDGTKKILASKTGYQQPSVPLPTNTWPLKFILKKDAE